jgi:ribonucleoside-diphosphate reductase alpha chain
LSEENKSGVYTREEVLKKTLEYFKGDTLASDVWINKYALKDSEGNLYELTPDDMHRRLAKEIARIESKYENPLSEDELFELMKDFKYIVPQGGPMSGIGNDRQIVSLSNCFVIGNEHDSYGGIIRTEEEQVQLMKRRGGVGHDLSHIRPAGTEVKNSALTSTGVVPFMERYSNATREVAQDGRRGALMLSTSIKTIDSEKFMDAKMEAGKVTGANISLKITDDFMESVKGDGKFTQQYPIDSKIPSITKQIDSKKLFKKIIHNAWKSAEPGILFWDTIIKESIPDCYSEKGFKTTTTNPCVVGDTLVAVADGRGFVSIKQLAEEGNDVPVYAKDGEKLVIKTMRNPRLTGDNQQIYKVNIEGGHSVRVTGNHRFTLKDGSIVEAKNLKYGDSLSILSKIETTFNDAFNSKGRPESDKNYIWLNNGYSKKLIQEHGFIYEQLNGVKIEQGSVIHHIDHNRLNNSIDNLCLMTSSEHNKLHTKEMLGENNPYHKMSDEWKFNFASRKGSANHTYIDVTNDELREHAIKLTKTLGRRYSNDEWGIYAKENNLPQRFSKFRSDALTGNITDLAKSVAIELGLENIDCDPRLVKTYENMLANNYNAKIVGNEVLVEKKCEMCGESFWINHNFREVSYCSISCSSKYLNTDLTIKNKRTNSVNEAYSKKGDENKD